MSRTYRVSLSAGLCCIALGACASVSVEDSQEWGRTPTAAGGTLEVAWLGASSSVAPELAAVLQELLPEELPRSLRWASAFDTVVFIEVPRLERRELVRGQPRWAVPSVLGSESPNARIILELRRAVLQRSQLRLGFAYAELGPQAKEAEVYGRVDLKAQWPDSAEDQQDLVEAVVARLAEEMSRRSFASRARR